MQGFLGLSGHISLQIVETGGKLWLERINIQPFALSKWVWDAGNFEGSPWQSQCCFMIISCNVRGLNKGVKTKEVSSCLYSLKPKVEVIIETRVKHDKAQKIRDKLKLAVMYIDNYNDHYNGRI